MSSTYKYRFIRSSWGVYLELTCEASVLSKGVNPILITDALYLQVDDKFIGEDQIEYLIKGLRLAAIGIERGSDRQEPVLIRVTDHTVVHTDYQIDGFACAILGWAAGHFGFTPPEIKATYNSPAHRYDYVYPDPE